MSIEERDDEVTAGTAITDIPALETVPETTRRRRGLPSVRLPSWLSPASGVLTWAGIVLALAGFVLIFVGWGQVAGETEVYLQLPYLVSAGLTGLGLVMVGVTLVNVSAKQRDAIERDRQIDRLVSIMEEVRTALEDREPPPPSSSSSGRPRRSARK